MPEFNQDLYVASREVLIENGVPWEVAEAASVVVANDDGTLPDLGRTAADQEVVQQAMTHYWAGQTDAQ